MTEFDIAAQSPEKPSALKRFCDRLAASLAESFDGIEKGSLEESLKKIGAGTFWSNTMEEWEQRNKPSRFWATLLLALAPGGPISNEDLIILKQAIPSRHENHFASSIEEIKRKQKILESIQNTYANYESLFEKDNDKIFQEMIENETDAADQCKALCIYSYDDLQKRERQWMDIDTEKVEKFLNQKIYTQEGIDRKLASIGAAPVVTKVIDPLSQTEPTAEIIQFPRFQ